MGCLYQIEFPNGKKYIGISRREANERAKEHFGNARKSARSILYSAIRKFGETNCKVKTLVVANDFNYLKDIEIRAIAGFKTKYPNGYNSTRGGDGVNELPDKIRKRANAALKKKWDNPERKKAVSDARKNNWKDPEYRKRISDKASAQMKNFFSNPDNIKMMSDRSKKNWKDPAYRETMEKSKQGMYESLDHRRKISDGLKDKWQDPEYRARMCAAQQRRWKRVRENAIQ